MPLLPGRQNMNSNYKELMSGVRSQRRERAIQTIMKNRGISKQEAMAVQAQAIVRAKARRK